MAIARLHISLSNSTDRGNPLPGRALLHASFKNGEDTMSEMRKTDGICTQITPVKLLLDNQDEK